MYSLIRTNKSYSAYYSQALGDVIRVLCKTERATFKVASVDIQIKAPIKLNQIYILLNNREEPEAYAVWAYVSEQTQKELIEDPNKFMHFSEWNDGDKLWIIDFVAPNGTAIKLAKHLKRHLSANHEKASWIKINRNKCFEFHHLFLGKTR